ncbi:hypothetical protein ACFVQ4_07415 [Streptomyces laurentii]|uniref:hypothetical protein n=1 Tax=Streptomyces laurentii TaxID=39478 RepID=UPI00368D4865
MQEADADKQEIRIEWPVTLSEAASKTFSDLHIHCSGDSEACEEVSKAGHSSDLFDDDADKRAEALA